MGDVTTIGLDIAKSVFQVHGVDAQGAVVVRQRLTRSRMLAYFAKKAPCLVGIEACGSGCTNGLGGLDCLSQIAEQRSAPRWGVWPVF